MTVSKDSTADPIVIFQKWYNQAQRSGLRRWILSWIYPPAVSSARRDDAFHGHGDGKPSVRIVLLKGVLEGGFVFTPTTSRNVNWSTIQSQPLCFTGFPRKQIRVEGTIKNISRGLVRLLEDRPRGISSARRHQNKAL